MDEQQNLWAFLFRCVGALSHDYKRGRDQSQYALSKGSVLEALLLTSMVVEWAYCQRNVVIGWTVALDGGRIE